MFPKFQEILQIRKAIRSGGASYDAKSNLNQGISVVPVSPYSFAKTIRYFLGVALGDKASVNECRTATPGRQLPDHVVGVRHAILNGKIQEAQEKLTILVAGDVMVSRSGKSIELDESFLDQIKKTDVFIMNIESSVNLSEEATKRGGLNFSMSKRYLSDLVAQLRTANPDLIIVYDIANNHSLDGGAIREKAGEHANQAAQESALAAVDEANFPLLRTVAGIKEIDKEAFAGNKAHIIGVHLAEQEYADVNCQVEALAVVEKNNVRCGFIGFTDILNHNAKSWDKRVVRSEDMPDLAALKEENNLDHLHLIGHGNLEQCIYPQEHFRNLGLNFLEQGADAITCHGPHIPSTNEIITCNDPKTGDLCAKPIIHSIGNLHGPKLLKNTGLNCMAQYTISSGNKIEFSLFPIETYYNSDDVPIVRVVEKDNCHYPQLQQRLDNLLSHEELPKSFNPNFKSNWHDLSNVDQNFVTQLEQLRICADTLWNEKDTVHARAADSLYTDLSENFNAYLSDKNAENFKTNSLEALELVDAKLTKNHKLKKVVYNLALAVVSCVVGYVIAVAINKYKNNEFAFFSKHKLSDQVADLKKNLEESQRDKSEPSL